MSISASSTGMDPLTATTSPQHAFSVPATNNGITPKDFEDSASHLRNGTGSHFAEFSNMLGQLRQSPSSAPIANVSNTGDDSPIINPTSSNSAINGNGNNNSSTTPNVSNSAITPQTSSNKKKQVNRRIRKNSTSIPATPNTPNTPGSTTASTNNTGNKRPRRRGGNGTSSNITTPATVKEEGEVTGSNEEFDSTNSNSNDKSNSNGNKKRRTNNNSNNTTTTSNNNRKISNKDDTKLSATDLKPESLLVGTNFIDDANDNDLLNVDPSIADFGNGDSFFDFGLYKGNDGGLGEFSWTDSVEGTNIN